MTMPSGGHLQWLVWLKSDWLYFKVAAIKHYHWGERPSDRKGKIKYHYWSLWYLHILLWFWSDTSKLIEHLYACLIRGAHFIKISSDWAGIFRISNMLTCHLKPKLNLACLRNFAEQAEVGDMGDSLSYQNGSYNPNVSTTFWTSGWKSSICRNEEENSCREFIDIFLKYLFKSHFFDGRSYYKKRYTHKRVFLGLSRSVIWA